MSDKFGIMPRVADYGLAASMEANAQALNRWMRLTAAEINALPQRLGMPVDLSSAVMLSAGHEPAEALASSPSLGVVIPFEPAPAEEEKPKGPPVSQLDALEL